MFATGSKRRLHVRAQSQQLHLYVCRCSLVRSNALRNKQNYHSGQSSRSTLGTELAHSCCCRQSHNVASGTFHKHKPGDCRWLRHGSGVTELKLADFQCCRYSHTVPTNSSHAQCCGDRWRRRGRGRAWMPSCTSVSPSWSWTRRTLQLQPTQPLLPPSNPLLPPGLQRSLLIPFCVPN